MHGFPSLPLAILLSLALSLFSRRPVRVQCAMRARACGEKQGEAGTWILWGPGLPPLITGLSAGSTAIVFISLFFDCPHASKASACQPKREEGVELKVFVCEGGESDLCARDQGKSARACVSMCPVCACACG